MADPLVEQIEQSITSGEALIEKQSANGASVETASLKDQVESLIKLRKIAQSGRVWQVRMKLM